MRSFIAVALVVGACGGAQQKASESLMDSIRTYHEGIRWARIPTAASRIPPEDREDFITEWDQLGDDLRVTDYELVQVAAGDRTTRVEVKYTWYLDSRMVVHETRATESWERRGKVWLMVEDRRLRGEQMPGLAEPAEEPEQAPPGPDSEAVAAD